ncbi:uncharacterized protein LOC126904816 [Daktulosphaira vitifoliae]|uniref:uncharacterized protein LOC126904816 n=1 Tax=Daktulosphaira vitifoliae TaxID=58002 RepID=UPI0021AA307A|nr:uncharacterized protein LOC126904816 [Daktulosphaira vitifoliae]
MKTKTQRLFAQLKRLRENPTYPFITPSFAHIHNCNNNKSAIVSTSKSLPKANPKCSSTKSVSEKPQMKNPQDVPVKSTSTDINKSSPKKKVVVDGKEKDAVGPQPRSSTKKLKSKSGIPKEPFKNSCSSKRPNVFDDNGSSKRPKYSSSVELRPSADESEKTIIPKAISSTSDSVNESQTSQDYKNDYNGLSSSSARPTDQRKNLPKKKSSNTILEGKSSKKTVYSSAVEFHSTPDNKFDGKNMLKIKKKPSSDK